MRKSSVNEMLEVRKPRVVLALALLFALIIITVPTSGVKAQETLLWEADVEAHTGAPVSSPVLEAGREYRIVAKGSFISCHPVYGWVVFAADAQYYTLEFDGTFPSNWWYWTSYLLASPSILQIDGMDVSWGPFSNGGINWGEGHEYTISYIGTGASITFTIVDWIDGDYAHNYCHIHVQIYERPPPPEAETAFAYGGEYATCFLSMDFDGDGKRDFNNWGWSNGPLGPGSYEFDIYAGAAKCNIRKGTLVGTLTIDYDGSTATVTYTMVADYMMQRTHLYMDGEPLPRNGGEYTVSPGQYPYIHDPVVDPASDTYTVSGLSGNIYVVAHADVVEA